MPYLTGSTWIRFLVWVGLGYVAYFVYARRHIVMAGVGGTPGHSRRSSEPRTSASAVPASHRGATATSADPPS